MIWRYPAPPTRRTRVGPCSSHLQSELGRRAKRVAPAEGWRLLRPNGSQLAFGSLLYQSAVTLSVNPHSGIHARREIQPVRHRPLQASAPALDGYRPAEAHGFG